MNDPIEAIIERALTEAAIQFSRDPAKHKSDFMLIASGVAIECKQFYSERAVRQLADLENVILIQGKGAALAFYSLLIGGHHGRDDTNS